MVPSPYIMTAALGGTAVGFFTGLAADAVAQLWELECTLQPVVGEDCGCLNCRRTFRVAVNPGALGSFLDTTCDAFGVYALQLRQPVSQFGASWFWIAAIISDITHVFLIMPLAFELTRRGSNRFRWTVLVGVLSRFLIQLLCFLVDAKYWVYWLTRASVPTALASYAMFDGTRDRDRAATSTAIATDCLRQLVPCL